MWTFFLAAFCAAVISAQWLPRFASASPIVLFFLAFFTLCLAWRGRQKYRLLAVWVAVLLGFAYSQWQGELALMRQLPLHWPERDFTGQVVIEDFAENKGRYWQFTARLEDGATWRTGGAARVLLNWYEPDAPPQPCQHWQMQVRLKPPHGLANPGGFDYQAYLLHQHIEAKGYVRKARRLADDNGFCLGRLRQQWRSHVLSVLPQASAAWMLALSMGDKSLLSHQQQQLLQQTGLAHLFVISGLHIGMVALAAMLLLLGLRRIGLGYFLPGDWRRPAWVGALLAAGAYALFSGISVPAQRALLMLIALLLGQWLAVSFSIWLRFWLAMALVLLVDPLAALSSGFALSFTAVAALILCAQRQPLAWQVLPGWQKMLRAQWAVFIALLPALLMTFHGASWLAPALNLVAIPLVSLLVLPLLLVAMLLWLLSGSDAGLLHLAGWIAGQLFLAVETLQHWLGVSGFAPLQSLWLSPLGLPVLAFAVVLLLLPRAWPLQGFALVLLLAAWQIQPKPLAQGELAMDVIDVGQGLAVLVRTGNHQLLYDTGASWTNGSMVELAVAPVLQQRGVTQLDKLILSHADNDHAGGQQPLLERFPVAKTLSSAPAMLHTDACEKGQHWQWDGVIFEILHPPAGLVAAERNNHSCVLWIQAHGINLLLPGDVEQAYEPALVEALPQPRVDVLVVPHHGSKTSSSKVLLQAAEGGLAVVSAGFMNRFGHPHADIVARYGDYHITLVNTAEEGLFRVDINRHGQLAWQGFRQEQAHYWFDPHRTAR